MFRGEPVYRRMDDGCPLDVYTRLAGICDGRYFRSGNWILKRKECIGCVDDHVDKVSGIDEK